LDFITEICKGRFEEILVLLDITLDLVEIIVALFILFFDLDAFNYFCSETLFHFLNNIEINLLYIS